MYDENFIEQVRLLLTCMPFVASEVMFALKGGTAINLFFDNLPRLSVDIDLTYLPIEDRNITIVNIQAGLLNIAKKIESSFPNFVTKPVYDKSNKVILKYLVNSKKVGIKIEPNFILRGHLYPIVNMDVCSGVKEKFDVNLSGVSVLDKDEVFAGKLCAALSRQHPRDLFDMMILLNIGPITDRMRHAFVVYLACGIKPIHEILDPSLHNIESAFNNEFMRMTDFDVRLDELLDVRDQLIKNVKNSLSNNEREFLFSIKTANPRFDLMPFDNLAEFPGIKWKLLNIQKMAKDKAEIMQNKLRDVLGL